MTGGASADGPSADQADRAFPGTANLVREPLPPLWLLRCVQGTTSDLEAMHDCHLPTCTMRALWVLSARKIQRILIVFACIMHDTSSATTPTSTDSGAPFRVVCASRGRIAATRRSPPRQMISTCTVLVLHIPNTCTVESSVLHLTAL